MLLKSEQLSENKKESVLTKAVLRAAEQLHIERNELCLILGVSASTLTRLFQQERTISLASKEGEISILLIKIYQSLMAILGGDLILCQNWLRNENISLKGIPLDLMKQITGIIKVLNYLMFMREKI